MLRNIKFALLIGIIGCIYGRCSARSSHARSAAAMLAMTQPMAHTMAAATTAYHMANHRALNRALLSERTKRGLFSNIASLASSGLIGGGGPSSHGSLSHNSHKDTDDDVAGLMLGGGSSNSNKPKPYDFNEVEMTAIQALVSLRGLLGELLQRVGLNIPSLASFITRSEQANIGGGHKVSFLSGDSASSGGNAALFNALTGNKASHVGVQVLRGLALTLPLLIPMATQTLRRMSPEIASATSGDAIISPAQFTLPQVPMMIPDLYYNQAMHRRRGKRSTTMFDRLRSARMSNFATNIAPEDVFGVKPPAVVGTPQHLPSSSSSSNQPAILRYLRHMEAKYAAKK